jgi:hypothetical protein
MNNTPSIFRRMALMVSLACITGGSVFSATPATLAAKPALQIPAVTTNPGVATEPTSSYKNYIYYGDRYRDPFVALNGDIRNDQSALDRPPQVASLTLKGIVQDAKGRMALLTSGLNSYILKGGRLYDGRNRVVKKIAGVIKTESVVIIGADRTVRELKTKAPL